VVDLRWLVLPLAVLVLSLGVACGGDDSSRPDTRTPEVTQPPPTETPTQAASPSTGTAEPTGTATTVVSGPELGRSISARNGCAACHSIDGSAGIGPTWLGLFGKEEQLSDGTTVVVDETYLKRAILEPDLEIVRGFSAGVMPLDYASKLGDEQLGALVEYIQSLE
jgi:cytochrome c oxidase subunit II